MRTIVAPRELHDRLGDPKLVVLDCRHSLQDFGLGRRLYDEGHVPGAFFASVEDDLAGPKTGRNGRHPLPDPETLARFLRGLGVDDDTLVVAYDAGADMFAARCWSLLRWIGHDDVAILDGGYAAWQACGYPVSAAPSEPEREGTLKARVRPQLIVNAEFVHGRLGSEEMHLIDARASDRFAGQNETIDPVAGHIPGARNRWFKNNFNDDGTLKSPERLREEYAQHDPGRVVHQCGSGVSSAVNQLAMLHAGLGETPIYAGSWSEWIADPSRPVATGAD
ncbi:MAG: sulfurtransferase [Candidatus Eremiobacteraeota bacterium]|nr:sulfurtransferase [Candidatus Eremiobacteraeota bacterium]MBV8332156.1 sulfurtransferase [Candidatus Eremiobacteraeota bacterium]